jgi:cytochrome c-type biogenesis protein CcmH
MPEGLLLFQVLGVFATLGAAALVAIPLLRNSDAPVMAVVLALAVPVGALFLYLAGSNYSWQTPTRQQAGPGPGSLDSAVAGLESRLRDEPEDRDGWLLLGSGYLQLQRPADAERAFSRALALGQGDDPIAKLGVAEARTLQDRSALAGEAGQMIEEVLAVQPDNPKALWYGGLVALARGDRPAVQARWELLLQMEIPQPVRQAVTQQLEALGLTPGTPAVSAAAPAVAGAAASAGTAIDVHVALGEGLDAQLAPGAMLFLVARDARAAGGPPVAAVREQASGLPRTLQISDANAMLAGRTISQLPRVRLIARVSNGGGAIAQPGDVFGEAIWTPGDGPVSIVMDQVVQP